MKTINKLTPRQQIKILLETKNLTQQEIASRLGMTRQNVNHVLSGRRKNPKVREALCKMLGVKQSEIWPSV